MLKVPIKITGNQSPNDPAVKSILGAFERFLLEEPTTCLIPWKIASNLPIIYSLVSAPHSWHGLKQYGKCGMNRDGKDGWHSFHFGTAREDTSYMTSLGDSDCGDWFEEGRQSYPCSVQDSDNAIDGGYLQYSSPSTDHHRFIECLQAIATRLYGRKLRIGAKSRRFRTTDRDSKPQNPWNMAENQPVHIDVDKDDADLLMEITARFMATPNRMQTIGWYGFKFMASPELSKNRSGSVDLRSACMAKHQLIVSNLARCTESGIRRLDEPFIDPHGKSAPVTLREIILEITNPPAPSPDQVISLHQRLFFSVDWTYERGQRNGDVSFIYYKDLTEAPKLANAMPGYVLAFFGEDALKWFFQPTTFDTARETDFIFDKETKEWTGKYKTAFDTQLSDVLDEEMHIAFDLTKLFEDQLSTTPQAKRVVHDDELSQHTFSAMYGREPQDRAQANPPEHQADASLGGVGPA